MMLCNIFSFFVVFSCVQHSVVGDEVKSSLLLQQALLAEEEGSDEIISSKDDNEPQKNEYDPICDHDGRRIENCADKDHRWMAFLSHEYCCNAEEYKCNPEDGKGLLMRNTFFKSTDPVYGDMALPYPARTGLECQHYCVCDPECAGWSYVYDIDGPLSELRTACFLKSTLENVEVLNVMPGSEDGTTSLLGATSGDRCACKTCESSEVISKRGYLDPRIVTQISDETQFGHMMSEFGFFVAQNVLPPEVADEIYNATASVADEMLLQDEFRLGNRGPRRYSLGSAQKSHHMVHHDAWVMLLNYAKPLMKLLDTIGNFMVVGGGGDFVLGETDTSQWMHVDLTRDEMYREAEPPAIAINFAVHDIECGAGSIRLMPGTHKVIWQYRTVADELQEFGSDVKYICPLKKGDAIIRDLRVWHAGSANLSGETRYFPNIELLGQWYADITRGLGDHLSPREILPKVQFDKLDPFVQKKAKQILMHGEMDLSGWDRVVLSQPGG